MIEIGPNLMKAVEAIAVALTLMVFWWSMSR